MKRRAFLSLLLSSPALAQQTPVDALLVGDSLAYQLASRLRKAMGQRKLAADGRGGSSTRQWRQKRWFQRDLELHPSSVVLVSLGVNCTRVERPKLADDIGVLVDICEDVFQRRLLWLLPPPLKFNTQYLRDAVAEVGCPSFDPGPLPLGDGVHPTHAGYEKWASLLVTSLWP